MTSIAELIAAAEPAAPRPIEGLLERLRAEGRLTGEPTATVVDLAVRSVKFDSRGVTLGSLFVAVPGDHADGHDYVRAAAEAGAVAAIVERPVEAQIPQVVVDRSRAALATAAAWWYGDPSAELGVVGITGTDGKTTTSYLATAALEAAGIPTGMLGTAALEIGGTREANPEHATTPEAPRLQAILRAMVTAGDRAAIVETTSHGLALDRVAGVRYDVALFTNLTHEHLELHGTFEAYRDAKRSLFDRLAVGPSNPPKTDPRWPRAGIVNADDPAAEVFVDAARQAGAKVVTYSREPSRRTADITASSVAAVPLELGGGLRMDFATPRTSGTLRSGLMGGFNASNLLAVLALGEALDLEPAAVTAGLESVRSIPGRMERIVAGQPFEVIVDYAHTPASLDGVVTELRSLVGPGRGDLIVVFGSAGERDTLKRPEMGAIAARGARLVVLADEDPRGEDREAILAEIAAGATAAGKVRERDLLLIPDRAAAIRTAVAAARPGDVVLLAGKGHESTILYADHALPWSEASAARAALADLGFEGGRTS